MTDADVRRLRPGDRVVFEIGSVIEPGTITEVNACLLVFVVTYDDGTVREYGWPDSYVTDNLRLASLLRIDAPTSVPPYAN